jgi:hypothetical protein
VGIRTCTFYRENHLCAVEENMFILDIRGRSSSIYLGKPVRITGNQSFSCRQCRQCTSVATTNHGIRIPGKITRSIHATDLAWHTGDKLAFCCCALIRNRCPNSKCLSLRSAQIDWDRQAHSSTIYVGACTTTLFSTSRWKSKGCWLSMLKSIRNMVDFCHWFNSRWVAFPCWINRS